MVTEAELTQSYSQNLVGGSEGQGLMMKQWMGSCGHSGSVGHSFPCREGEGCVCKALAA